MRSHLLASSLAALFLSFGVAAGCSSDINPTTDAAAAGRDGSAAGTGGGTDAAAGAAGQTADASPDVITGDTADSVADVATSDVARDTLLADISKDSVLTDSAESITLTSTALAQGAAFMATNTCAGANTPPPLSWTAGPAGTMSYAVVLTDLSNGAVHWVVWDLPVGTTSLPAGLPGDTTLAAPAGAKQLHKVEYFGPGGAYRGPCPSGANHVYQLEVNAIPTATLAGVPATPTTEGLKVAVQAVSLAHGDLEGTSNATAAPVDAAATQ